MNRKITRFARAGKCGGFADSGSIAPPCATDSSAKSDASASEPKPTAVRPSKARRESRISGTISLVKAQSVFDQASGGRAPIRIELVPPGSFTRELKYKMYVAFGLPGGRAGA